MEAFLRCVDADRDALKRAAREISEGDVRRTAEMDDFKIAAMDAEEKFEKAVENGFDQQTLDRLQMVITRGQAARSSHCKI